MTKCSTNFFTPGATIVGKTVHDTGLFAEALIEALPRAPSEPKSTAGQAGSGTLRGNRHLAIGINRSFDACSALGSTWATPDDFFASVSSHRIHADKRVSSSPFLSRSPERRGRSAGT